MEKENKNLGSFSNLKEEDVGITQYINIESKGFDSILKHRYSDFLVNEIDADGNVVWLKSNVKISPPEKKEAKSAEVLKSEADIDKTIDDNFLNIITNVEDVKNFKEFLYKYVNK